MRHHRKDLRVNWKEEEFQHEQVSVETSQSWGQRATQRLIVNTLRKRLIDMILEQQHCEEILAGVPFVELATESQQARRTWRSTRMKAYDLDLNDLGRGY